MDQIELAMGLNAQFGLPLEEQITALREVGFNGFFAYWRRDTDFAALKRAGDQAGMAFQFIHANQMLMEHVWQETERTEEAVDELFSCLRDCADNGIPLMVAHAIDGFDWHTPTPMGIRHFEKLVQEAERLHVRIALENAEGEEYLAALMERFHGNPYVGSCWDSGHEMCYNRKDMLALYGDRLLCTHLNDNMGMSSQDGKMDWQDDLHLLPFDGIGDWEEMMGRLEKTGYHDMLTFELKISSPPSRHENDPYRKMDIRDYFTQAYMRSCRVAALKKRDVHM